MQTLWPPLGRAETPVLNRPLTRIYSIRVTNKRKLRRTPPPISINAIILFWMLAIKLPEAKPVFYDTRPELELDRSARLVANQSYQQPVVEAQPGQFKPETDPSAAEKSTADARCAGGISGGGRQVCRGME